MEREQYMLSVSTQIAREDDISLFRQMLKSVSFADEILIYNMGRDEKELREETVEFHPRIISIKTPKIVEQIRTRQVTDAEGDWVLIMDFDEIVTPELASEILSTVKNTESGTAAFRIARRNYSLGFPISHGGFGDDFVHRLFRRSEFKEWPTNIHSTPVVSGTVRQLVHFMEHHKDASLSQMVTKTNRYSDIES
jgi:hypothetical protein